MLGIIVDVLNGVCGQSCLDERVFAAASEGDAGLACRTATLEHACVAGADAERKGIGGDVRPCLVDHGNDAHGHRHALHAYTGVEGAAPAHASKRVILPGDLLEGGGNGLEAGGIEHEPVKKGPGMPAARERSMSLLLEATMVAVRSRMRRAAACMAADLVAAEAWPIA